MTLCAAGAAALLVLLPRELAAPRRARGAGRRRRCCSRSARCCAPASTRPSSGRGAGTSSSAGSPTGCSPFPGIASPYRGDDEWVRATVLLGGGLLAALATLQAFWPRARRARLVSPVPAAMSLTLLCGVAVIEVPPERPLALRRALRGAARGVPVRRPRAAPCRPAPAAICVLGATILAVVARAGVRLGTAVDRPRADLRGRREHRHDRLHAGTTATAPLDWPREGRELLRDQGAGAGLLEGAGARHVRRPRLAPLRTRSPPFEPDGEVDEGTREWVQTIEVSVRGLRSEQFVTAGQALGRRRAGRARRSASAAGRSSARARDPAARRALQARVYTPRPQRRRARPRGDGLSRPGARLADGRHPRRARRGEHRARRARARRCSFAPFGSGEADSVERRATACRHDDADARTRGHRGSSGSTRSPQRLRARVARPRTTT